MNNIFNKKNASAALIAVMTVWLAIGPMAANVAYAQKVSATIDADIPQQVKDIKEKIGTKILTAGVTIFYNALQKFTSRIAYDAANYIANGGKGQSALVFKKGPGAYLKDVAGDAAGQVLGDISDLSFFRQAGLNLCAPPNPQQLLQLQLSIGSQFPGLQAGNFDLQPRCDFQQVIQNYRNLYTTLSNTEIYDYVTDGISFGGSDLGVSLTVLGRANSLINEQVGTASEDRKETGAFRNLEDIVSGNVRTPAAVIQSTFDQSVVKDPKSGELVKQQGIIANAYKAGAAQLGIYTASVFINTLSSKVLNKVMQKGLIKGLVDAFKGGDKKGTGVNTPDAAFVKNAVDTRLANIDLRDVNLLRNSDIEILSDLYSCPDEGRNIWNCAMDESLAQVVSGQGDEGNLTIGKAIEEGLMKPDWTLIPVTQAKDNQDRLCYTRAYCAGNLAKLRAMRIIPVGFEFAANSPENVARCQSGACVTLKEVVDGFSQCNDQGMRDSQHPWCKLVDSNWVLTSFPQQCRLSGYGDTLISSRTAPERREECRDVQTCLQRDEKGQCVGGYGYCVAEKTTYRFNSTQCLERNASCRSYTTRAGLAVSYLRNTVDGSVCTSDNVGCQGYFNQLNADGTWNTSGTKFYADKTLTACASGEEGCTKLLAAEIGGTALNLLQNASFETSNGTPAKLVGWTSSDANFDYIAPVVAENGSIDSSRAYEAGTATLSQSVTVIPGNVVTVSTNARAKSGGAASVTVSVNTGASAGDLAAIYRSSGCIAAGNPGISASGFGTNWQRFECSFVVPPGATSANVAITGSNALVDAVQFEEGEYATAFVDGTNRSLPVVHMKVAPQGLVCNGTSTDPTACGKFAKVCKQVDAGCQGYTDAAGGDEVPAILSKNDLCPQQCVGYAEFRKQASAFDLVKDIDTSFSDDADTAPDYFIPSTASQCKQEDVGCETFTNVEQSVQGGETAQSFSYLRACRKPDATRTKSYYVWEGSAESGYQLRTFSLISAVSIVTGESVIGPEILAKRGTDGTVKAPASCNENLWRTGTDPDCRQFYDKDGNVFYRYYSQTVLSTDQCVALRISRSGQGDDCRKTGGDFNQATGECVYNAYLGESRSCSASVASCRAFKGTSSGSVQTVLSESFRVGVGSFSNGASSEESVLVGDRSLQLSSSAALTVANYANEKAALYRVSFWAKAPGNAPIAIQLRSLAGSNPATSIGSVSVGSDWQRYSLGLFAGPDTATAQLEISVPGIGARSVFIDEVRVERVQDTVYVVNKSWNTPIQCDTSYAGAPEPQAMLGCREYKDRFNNTVYAHRFTRLCKDEAIGCRAFVDTRNSDSAYEQSFTQQDATPVAIATGSSTAVTNYPSSTTVRPADRMLYLVYDKTKLCQPENASCTAFGKPSFSPDRATITGATTVYLKDDITKYGEALCKPSEEMCEEFSHQGAKEYFRAPAEKVCEYKEGIQLSSASFPNAPTGSPLRNLPEGTYSGYFIQGSTTPCYPSILENGNTFGMAQRGDAAYAGWTALCPASQDSCTEFRDVNDRTDPDHTSGKPYFFLNDDNIDKASCGGQIDPANGCVLLRDMADTTLRYNAKATALAYEKNGYKPTAPIDCVGNPTNDSCVAVKDPTKGDVNDANLVVKVNLDRDCAQWLGCRSSETVFDPATRNYKDICTDIALCDKSTGKPGDIFCAHYVDRASTTTEPILAEGVFFDSAVYSSREVGLGVKDYSGYALPNAFQVSDTKTLRVGKDGLTPAFYPEAAFRFGQDYRLSARVKMGPSRVFVPVGAGAKSQCIPNGSIGPNLAKPLDNDAVGMANPGLNLCSYTTKEGKTIIGFYNATECSASKPFYCYLPIKADNDTASFEKLAEKFKLADPKSDSALTAAYPPAECRSSPEADSPFSNSYVATWDNGKTPSAPLEVAEGLENANLCEFGQDCVCTYKRVTYNSQTKFYAPTAQNVVPAICVGGPRDGQTCIPSSLTEGTVSEGTGADSITQGITAANSALSCGQNGQCVQYTKLEIIKGVFGQCLERDTTQFIGTNQADRPCLTWDPNPILFGDKDPFHYQPTAGYLPPQNAGQYYCTSGAKPATKISLDYSSIRRYYQGGDNNYHPDPLVLNSMEKAVSDACEGGRANCSTRWTRQGQGNFDNQFRLAESYYVGEMKQLMFRPWNWVPEKKDGAFDVVEPSRGDSSYNSIVGATGYATWNLCKAANSYVGTNPDYKALRLVDSADGYTETFYRINSPGVLTMMGAAPTAESAQQILSDANIGYIRVQATNNGEVGRLACGYQSEYVDSVGNVNYEDQTSLVGGEAKWRTSFETEYSPYLSRANENMVKDSNGVDNMVARCVGLDIAEQSRLNSLSPSTTLPGEGEFKDSADGSLVFDGDCQFKTWDTSYRMASAEGAFSALENGLSLENIRANPYRSNDSCKSSPNPWFGIRAVFQSKINSATRKPDGTWSFVGFWVSSCAGKSGGDHRFMYFTVDLGTASICKELGEVKSASTGQDAAFTDRIWAQGQYRDPATGLQWSTTNAPFSSALNTGVAGKEPLFQDGGEMAGFSNKVVPTFLRSGVRTYYATGAIPRDKYAFLSNMFARVYRVYTYQFTPVNKGDLACLRGPLKGKNCTDDAATGDNSCLLDGECRASALTAGDRAVTYACNKGPGKGLECSSTPECQGIVVAGTGGAGKLKARNRCILDTTKAAQNGDGSYRMISPAQSGLSVSAAATLKAFKCNGVGNLNGGGSNVTNCNVPTDGPSDECPIITGGEVVTACVRQNSADAAPLGCSYSGSNGTNDIALASALTASGIARSTTSTTLVAPKFNGNYVACTTVADCNVTKDDAQRDQKCAPIPAGDTGFGRCVGGLRENEVCRTSDTTACRISATSLIGGTKNSFEGSCGPTTDLATCPAVPGDANSDDPDKDTNACTHGTGYYPRLDLCPNPADEYCGLVSYRITDKGAGQSMDPTSGFPLPTDVTLGHYTPNFLGLTGSDANTFNYITYYTPRPPMVAAPDTRNCATPGQCEIARTNAFNLSGQTSGALNAGIGQFVAGMRFYAWAAHNQMPLKRIYIDWGDGQNTKIADTKLKNHKPYCNVQSECSDLTRASGLTCNADGDCPAGAGLCKPTGVCQKQPQKYCSADAECGTVKGDKCVIRTMFGNSRDACDSNYFDFQHVYVCNDSVKDALIAAGKTCQPSTVGHCSRNAALTCSSDTECTTKGSPGDTCVREVMAEPGGCFDTTTNSCHFTPRLQVMDNWGWCTGECRDTSANGVLADSGTSTLRHTYGGCYAGAANDPELISTPTNIRPNSRLTDDLAYKSSFNGNLNECSTEAPAGASGSVVRPWIVYPGAVQIRPSN